MKFKKFSLVAILLISLAGCGKSNSNGENPEDTSSNIEVEYSEDNNVFDKSEEEKNLTEEFNLDIDKLISDITANTTKEQLTSGESDMDIVEMVNDATNFEYQDYMYVKYTTPDNSADTIIDMKAELGFNVDIAGETLPGVMYVDFRHDIENDINDIESIGPGELVNNMDAIEPMLLGENGVEKVYDINGNLVYNSFDYSQPDTYELTNIHLIDESALTIDELLNGNPVVKTLISDIEANKENVQYTEFNGTYNIYFNLPDTLEDTEIYDTKTYELRVEDIYKQYGLNIQAIPFMIEPGESRTVSTNSILNPDEVISYELHKMTQEQVDGLLYLLNNCSSFIGMSDISYTSGNLKAF